jgi:hypothetical protein
MEVKISAILAAVAGVRPTTTEWAQPISDMKSEWHVEGGAFGLKSELFHSSAIGS